ncbi:MAG: hypothetical protein RR565_00635 [Erysipelothrix sp.]
MSDTLKKWIHIVLSFFAYLPAVMLLTLNIMSFSWILEELTRDPLMGIFRLVLLASYFGIAYLILKPSKKDNIIAWVIIALQAVYLLIENSQKFSALQSISTLVIYYGSVWAVHYFIFRTKK